MSRFVCFVQRLGFLAVVAVLPTVADAQTTGIAVERMFFQSGPSAFYQVQGAEVAAPLSLWLHAGALVMQKPLTFQHQFTRETLAVPVDHRVTLDVGAELGLWKERLSLRLGLPVAMWQNGDRLQRTGGEAEFADRPLRTSAVGDVRVGLRMRLTRVDSFWGVLASFDLTVPGGGQTDFVATDGPTVMPTVVGYFRKGPVSAAVNVAARLAPTRQLYETTLQHSIEWGAAASARFPVSRVGLALITEAVGFYYPSAAVYSQELRAGLRLAAGAWAVDVGGGGGFSVFAPPWRGFLSFRGVFQKRRVATCAERPSSL